MSERIAADAARAARQVLVPREALSEYLDYALDDATADAWAGVLRRQLRDALEAQPAPEVDEGFCPHSGIPCDATKLQHAAALRRGAAPAQNTFDGQPASTVGHDEAGQGSQSSGLKALTVTFSAAPAQPVAGEAYPRVNCTESPSGWHFYDEGETVCEYCGEPKPTPPAAQPPTDEGAEAMRLVEEHRLTLVPIMDGSWNAQGGWDNKFQCPAFFGRSETPIGAIRAALAALAERPA